MNTENPTPAEPKPETFDSWALVELFGHQKIVGRVTETTMFGGALLRVDVPAFDKEPGFTRFYNPKAVYSLNPVTEAVARGLMTRYRNVPVEAYELPLLENGVNADDAQAT